MAKLSIIIPVYNMSEQLVQCILTIQQTVRLPYEVIIVDDGSVEDEHVSISMGGGDIRILHSEEHRGFSHAVNMGIRASVGEVLLFLHADALYHGWSSFVATAEAIRARGKAAYPEILAEMIALMVRRDVVEAAGFLDEQYQVPALAAYDYTVRMTRAGYGIAVLPYVYVHHNEGRQKTEEYERTCERERAFFHTKWGVELSYSFQERHDLFPLMDLQREGLRVLEIGCACGGTLRAIGVQNPSAKLYGVELNENAAVIAASFAEILSMNVEELDPADFQERFDYIIMGDVIEHLLEPWAAICNMRELLVPGGSIIASIPNVAHISNLYNMLCGRWTYEDCGLLDRTHFRFFTKSEIVKMFEEADLVIDDIRPRQLILDESWKVFREEILSLRMVDVKPEDVDAFQWLVCARRV